MNDYEIVKGFVYHGVQYWRVINLETEVESALCTYDECVEIIRMARAGQLMGSFQ